MQCPRNRPAGLRRRLSADHRSPDSVSRSGAADGQPFDQQGWLADARWHRLPAFAADADALVECHVIADRLDAGQRRRAIADQGCALDRGAELAVLDLISYGAGEDELARSNVHLAAAEAFGVNAILRA